MSARLNLRVIEIKAFIPAKDFELSKQFYRDIGFSMESEGGGVAYFHFENVSFLLQDFFIEALAKNFMMHMLVEDLDAWWNSLSESGIAAKYGTKITNIELQPWRMRDFCLADPSGVLWRIAQNCN
ncbi:MAG TPA: VOC family protein [Steroidobacteraceae bacterium]